MSLWRHVTRGLSVLLDPSKSARDADDEVRHYEEEMIADHMARGLSPAAARRAAALDIGGATQVREQMLAHGWEHLVSTTFADFRYGARGLRAAPGFTIVTILTLAVGIGAVTAIASVVQPVLFSPPPYPDAGRLVMIWEAPHLPQTFATYREILERGRTLQGAAVLRAWQPTLIGNAEPERLEGQRVSASYFGVLGVAPILGRDFTAADDRRDAPRVAVVSHALWQRRFRGDPSAIGQVVPLDGGDTEIIGVMPATFENVLAPAAEVWAPLRYDMSQGSAWGHHLRAIARLGAGVPFEQAAVEVDRIGRDFAARHPEAYGPRATSVLVPLHDELTRPVRPALMAIFGAAVLVLAIACVNVTNLLLARGVRRRAEFGLRAALGAGRLRLVRQVLAESLLLALAGGALGVAFAVAGVQALVALGPADLPRAATIGLNAPVLVFTCLTMTLVGIAFGLAPGLRAADTSGHPDLRTASPRATSHVTTRGALVVVEIALALVLLVTSGLLLRSIQQLFAVDAGFDPARLLTMQVQTSGPRFATSEPTNQFFADALDAVRRVPGVTDAAFTSQLPLSGDVDEYGVHFAATPKQPARSYNSFRYAVTARYFDTVRIPLRGGRGFDERDRDGAPRVAIISESLARRRFGAESPIGHAIRIGPPNAAPYSIVGVAGDVRQLSLAIGDADAVYVPASQWQFTDNAMSLVVKSSVPAPELAPAIRRAIWSIDKDQPIVRVATMDALLAASAAERRFALTLFELFALAALVLAAAGIYGVLSGSVAERTREIGVRAALGASQGSIVALVLRQGMTLAAIGAMIGLAGAAVASQALSALLFGISRLDPITYAGMATLLVLVSAIACAIPAWRAVTIDPATTLRAE